MLTGKFPLSQLKIYLALIYILVSSAPAFYLSPAVMLCMVLVGVISFVVKFPFNSLPTSLIILIALLAYVILTSILSGLGVFDLISYEAIRYDTNLFYSVLPLFVLGDGVLTLEKIDWWLKRSLIIGVLLLVFSTAIGVPIFESHNAAGGYYMVLLSYFIARSISDGLKGRLLYIVLGTFALIASDSRGSILAVLLSTTFALIGRRSKVVLVCLLVGAVIISILGLCLLYKIWVGNGAMYLYDYSSLNDVSRYVDFSAFHFGERPGTIIHRLLFLYPMAIDLFISSPIIGIGFTRFDDFPISLLGVSGIYMLNHSPEVSHTNLHAHNSYLHILAETGIVGLIFFIAFITALLRGLKEYDRLACIANVVLGSLLIASITEHRFTSPSQAAPVFIIIGLLYSARRSVGKGRL